jgi:hypothetical protein
MRRDLISALADVDDLMGDLYLQAMNCQVQDEGSGVFDSCPIASNITTVDIQSAEPLSIDPSCQPCVVQPYEVLEWNQF